MPVRSVHINITNSCNLKCNYCYYFDDNATKNLIAPEYPDIVHYIDQAEEVGAKLIVISGGEALLNERLFDILEYGQTPKILITNGILLNEEVINRFNDIRLLKDLKLSFDGFLGHDKNRGKGTSEIVLEKLFLLDRLAKFPYSINTVVTNDNYDELMTVYEVLLTSRAYRWEVDFPLLGGRANNEKFIIENEEKMYNDFIVPIIKRYIDDGKLFKINMLGVLRWEFFELDNSVFQTYNNDLHPCEYAIDSFTIHTNGDVGFCPSLSLIFGNLKKSSLSEILSSKEYLNFKTISVNKIAGCSNCRYTMICGGGCRGDALVKTGDIESLDPLSCKRMVNFEKYVLDILPDDTKNELKKLINIDGYNPTVGESKR